MGSELTVGLTVTGLCQKAPVTLQGAKPGDVLILTKPIGSGTLMAAEMAGAAFGGDLHAALLAMSQPQGAASALLAPVARAMTDVTGFGLAGHLAGICEASGVGAELQVRAVPLLPGALALAQAGVRSSLTASNIRSLPQVSGPETPAMSLMFDQQTAGGLLAAVPADAAEDLVQELRRSAAPEAATIGTIRSGMAIQCL